MSRKTKAMEFAGEGYKIHVTGRNVLVTDAMKDYAQEKVSKIERFSHRIMDVHVTMDIQKLDHRVDIVIKVDNIKITGHSSCTDMYVSIDKAVDKIEKQLRRYKNRLHEHQAKSLSAVDMNVNVISTNDPVDELNDEIEEENQQQMLNQFNVHEVVATETRPLKQLTQAEAVMKMDLSGDSFMIYRCEEDQKLKVIYARNDGNYGVIEIEA